MYNGGYKMERMELKARAKINLTLDIVGKRENGYHEVDMIMQQVDLFDKISLTKQPEGITINCPARYVPSDRRNIAYKAIKAVQDECNVSYGVKIDIDKKIPVAAGLGGGSSNAAAVIKGYNQLYDLNLSLEKMRAIGRTLGADVNFFFTDHAARATGIGEKIQPIPGFKSGWLVLCKPNIGVSTASVYKSLNYQLLMNHPNTEKMVEALKEDNIYEISENLSNVLETVTLNKHTVVKKIKSKMLDYGALGALMSGSGPTVFGIFRNYDEGLVAFKKFKKIYGQTYLIKTYNG